MTKLKFHLNGRLLTWQVFENDWSDYLTFIVMSPKVCYSNVTVHDIDQTKEFSLELPTKISFEKSDCSWSFVVRFMGFGFQVFRQWGY
jgi:hypothetical protein